MNFEAYSDELLSASKRFFEEAKNAVVSSEKQRMLRASLTHAFFFLEAQLNYVAAHFSNNSEFSTVERSLLTERDIALKNGKWVLTDKQKFFRIEDRIEFLLARFSTDLNEAKGVWFSTLKSSIKVRNRLVHPKEAHTLSNDEVETAILATLDCVSSIYLAVFDKEFPPHSLGLHLGPK